MEAHVEQVIDLNERTSLGERAWPLYNFAKIAGFVGIIGGVLLGYFADPGFRRFYFAYLVSFCFFLSIALGSLGFVLLQYLTRAGWSVNVRRVAECLAVTMPILAALSAPILLSVLLNRGALYRWAQPVPASLVAHDQKHEAEAPAKEHAAGEHATPTGESHGDGKSESHATGANVHPSANGVAPLDALTLSKRPMLNRWSFTVRILLYFAVWTGLATWYWRKSTTQDKTNDYTLTEKMQSASAPAIVVLMLTLTFAAFDLLMSLDPHWFSTIFGIYFLAGSLLATFASMILILSMLQSLGYLTKSVTTEHYHDLGKWLFAFVFFWGYIAFSQYMLLWYSSIPEETGWLARRGATTAQADINGWSWVSIILLFGQLLIPFAGLMSRHVKRKRKSLMFWAAWVLVFHWVDLFWLIGPELDGKVHFGVIEILCFLGVGGVFLATYLRFLARSALRPLSDPRLSESVEFENL